MPVNPLGEMSLKMSTEHSCIMINIGEPPFFLVSHSQKKCRVKYLFINQVRDHKPLFERRLSQNQHTKHVSVFFFSLGLIADKYGNYTLAFLMSGGVLVIGSLFPFFLLCSKQKNVEENEGVEHLEELMDRDQVVIKKNSESDNPSPTTVWVMQESVPTREVVARSNNKLATAKRPVSFMWAMESPFNLPPPLRTSN